MARTPGNAEIVWPTPSRMEVVFAGYVDNGVMTRLLETIRAELANKTPGEIFFDTDRVEGYDAAIRGVASSFLGVLKESGIKRAAASTPNPLVRMFGAALSVGVGFRIRFASNRADAIALLDK